MVTMNVWFRSRLRTRDDAKVAFCSGAECLKSLLVSIAFMSGEGNLVAVEFDKYRPQRQSGLVGLNLARGSGQKVPAERLNCRQRQCPIDLYADSSETDR